jgi:pilus assembly protein Flp/PilA
MPAADANPRSQRKTEQAMSRILNTLGRLKDDADGAALVEYTVLLGIMLVAVIATIVAVGGWINTKWTTLNTALAGQ